MISFWYRKVLSLWMSQMGKGIEFLSETAGIVFGGHDGAIMIHSQGIFKPSILCHHLLSKICIVASL